MFKIISLLILIHPAHAFFRAESRIAAATLKHETYSIAGLTREVLVQEPEAKGPWPLVLVLHGGSGKADGMAAISGFAAVAQQEKFIAAFPDSGVGAWNDGRPGNPKESKADDVGWLSNLARRFIDMGRADRRRVYVCGLSNGAFMSMRLACEQPGLFAAVGAVAGTDAGQPCPNAHPIPVCLIQGTDDPLVPFEGGEIRLFRFTRSRGQARPFEQALTDWLKRDHASFQAQSAWLDQTQPPDGTRTQKRFYPALAGGADVLAYVIQGGGHTWPGGRPYLPAAIVGKVNHDLNASTALWEFFKAHPMPMVGM